MESPRVELLYRQRMGPVLDRCLSNDSYLINSKMLCFIPAGQHMIESPKERLIQRDHPVPRPLFFLACAPSTYGHSQAEAARPLSMRHGKKVCELAWLGDTEDSKHEINRYAKGGGSGCQSADESSLWT